MEQLRQGVATDHADLKKKEFDAGPKASQGYGGKFGVQTDRMDKVELRNFEMLLNIVIH